MSDPIHPSTNTSPFHRAELEIQERLGVRDKLAPSAGRVIRDHMPEQHRSFFAQLPFICIGAVDAQGQPWASVLAGRPGFVSSPDPKALRIDARPLPDDPLHALLAAGSPVGLLGIELPTRRRNRMNGEIVALDGNGFTVRVGQSFGNCPQYIQRRDYRFLDEAVQSRRVSQALASSRLNAEDRALIAAADTFFIASANLHSDAGTGRGVDISHRGGRAGFVRIDDDATLTVPDFLGNFFFNTLGNLQVEPRAGLLFIDFESGDLLHIACEAQVIWDGDEVRAFAGAERLLRLRLTKVLRVRNAIPLRWSGVEYSPLLESTGTWEQAMQALEAERQRNRWRPFRVQRVVDESAAIRSLILAPADGAGVAAHVPGQFIPLRVPAGDAGQFLQRTYTLSDAANGHSLRISVKREGRVSAWLHDRAGEGSVIEILAPRGGFVFDAVSPRPAVLLSAGVGITPMIAMLNSVFVNEGRTRFPQPVFFIHGARNGREQAFADLLRRAGSRHPGLAVHLAYSQPTAEDELGRTHDSVGRVDIALLKRLLPPEESASGLDFYLCGPPAFMQSLYEGLRALHVPDRQIRFESFGPASVVRRARQTRQLPAVNASAQPVTVSFARSQRTAEWRDPEQSLLELAEAAGLAPLYGCRSGTCGSCATGVISGQVDYRLPIEAQCEPGHALLCTAVPAAHEQGLVLDL